jgi:O-antigen ligase
MFRFTVRSPRGNPNMKASYLFRAPPSLHLALILLLMGTLWIAGGASRADVFGQVVVRGGTVALLIVGILFGPRPDFGRAPAVAALLLGSILVVVLQLIPLPPSLWSELPGRQMLLEAAAASQQSQPWRPLAIEPSAALNAAYSLLIPVAVLTFMIGMDANEQQWPVGAILALVAGSTLITLLQFSGAGFDNPLINDTPGQVSGTFANRNHMALFLAIGVLLVPVWTFWHGHRPSWRGPVGLGLLTVLFLSILATGSRAGLFLGALAVAAASVIAKDNIRKLLRRAHRWAIPVAMAAVVSVLVIAAVAIEAGRAVAINRLLAMDPAQDVRTRALSTVLSLVREYFPWGTGFGGFDTAFRIHEPFHLLKPTYFNHAHNDFLEIALNGGVAGVALMMCAIGWWFIASTRAWRISGNGVLALPKLGSAMILLILIASLFDYPVRTPMIMAMLVVAATWLCRSGVSTAQSPLPEPGQHL